MPRPYLVSHGSGRLKNDTMRSQHIFQRSPVSADPGGNVNGGVIKVGIVGGAGYTGGELTRILLNHTGAAIAFVHSTSNAGKYIHEVHADLLGESSLKFSQQKVYASGGGGDLEESFDEADVLFLCV